MSAILWINLLLMANSNLTEGQLIVSIQNLETASGAVHFALYDKEDFFLKTDKRVSGLSIPVTSKAPLEVSLGSFPLGNYALAVFQDLNDNGKLDKSPLGIPTEPYAFSNNVRAKWRAPTFQESRFELRQPKLRLNIFLKRWKAY